MARYPYRPFAYRPPPELRRAPAVGACAVAIVGAGPVGLTLAIDLAQHGIPSVVLDENDVVSVGSRAICWSKRTLEIFDRLGVGERMVAKGVTWKTGRLFNGATPVYHFDLQPEPGHERPAFINLQQYYVEEYLVDRCGEFPDLIDLRWKNTVVDHSTGDDGVRLEIDTPDGRYRLDARYLVACDGAHSATRRRMGLAFEGERFDEQFLITDVEMRDDPFDAGGVPERWFWFRPPFHDGQSALLHKQPDDIYRIDLQLGPDADTALEKDETRVRARLAQMLGHKPFTIDWLSIYRFTCARLARFVHGRVIFCGDAAHVVSPFGARGGNSGIQDVDNLAWKLAAVIRGEAGPRLLASYDEERTRAADENILNSVRATRFMTPKSDAERRFRDGVLALAKVAPFARRLVNSGRLSLPCHLGGVALVTDGMAPGLAAGSPCVDAPLSRDGVPGWLLREIGGAFVVLTIGEGARGAALPGVSHCHVAVPGEAAGTGKLMGGALLETRYGRDVAYLIRPDQHVACAAGPSDFARLGDALEVALGRGVTTPAVA